jgi:hypothetical protein
MGAGDTCEQEVVDQLVDLQRHAMEYARRDGLMAADEAFYAERNAKVVKNAAEYYLPHDVRRESPVVEPPGPSHGRDPRGDPRAPDRAAR